ncbi:hemolysin family protein [Desulfogranum japonicum]|uniref:hemolysin family protein n=1 Tax=Desulfogranum japonicum TaxID=231447 RepID=UPI000491DB87|nr:hemolysin family protein [Desulfogranum japonicum]
MDKSSETTTQDEAPSSKGVFDRLRSVFRLRATPDTTEELEHEIQELLEEGEEQGLITSEEERLISSIFDFRETEASEIMTPLADMVCAEEHMSIEELVQLINDEGYTRIPLYRETLDHIIGILHAKDLLRICANGNGPEHDIHQYLIPPAFIRESKPITELLREFQAKKNHLAIVVDEFDSVRGLITLEDVIEEIVGEIDDEHDQDESWLRIVDDQTVIVDAKIDVEDVERHFAVTLPEGPYESVGGFIVHQLGRVPDVNTIVESDQLVFRVLGADKRRVKSVRIKKRSDVVLPIS